MDKEQIVDMHTCQCQDCRDAQENQRLIARAEVIEEIRQWAHIRQETMCSHLFQLDHYLTKLSEAK